MSSRQRDDVVRLRPVRAAWFVVSMTLTLLAVVAAVGVLPAPSVAVADGQQPARAAALGHDWLPLRPLTGLQERLDRLGNPAVPAAPERVSRTGSEMLAPEPPARSGTGRRVVFDESAQQVWLVRDEGTVRTTYPVSGSVYDNLQPGHYRVYSRSEQATSFDYTSTMRWMVRFTEGDNAAIGFHAIPRYRDGDPVQTWQQLGTPMSHGCIRQRPRDALALWRFAPVGTAVVVVA